MNIDQLNTDFGIPGHVTFLTGKGELPVIQVQNALATALVSVYAGQVLSFKPAGAAEDLLFLSDSAYYQQGKAIKGGVPVCWPWFGPDPEDKGRSAHGFVRNRLWSVIATEVLTTTETRLVLGLQDSPETRKIWPYSFELVLEITLGSSLGLELVSRNSGDRAFTVTQALHTYFKIGDISQVKVQGLEHREYLDKVDKGKRKVQEGEVVVATEVDRIYTGVSGDLIIDDAAYQRRIRISSSGSRTAVVWNPWSKIAAEMADLADQDYLRLLCVETANAADDLINVPPAGEFRLRVDYQVEPRE